MKRVEVQCASKVVTILSLCSFQSSEGKKMLHGRGAQKAPDVLYGRKPIAHCPFYGFLACFQNEMSPKKLQHLLLSSSPSSDPGVALMKSNLKSSSRPAIRDHVLLHTTTIFIKKWMEQSNSCEMKKIYADVFSECVRDELMQRTLPFQAVWTSDVF